MAPSRSEATILKPVPAPSRMFSTPLVPATWALSPTARPPVAVGWAVGVATSLWAGGATVGSTGADVPVGSRIGSVGCMVGAWVGWVESGLIVGVAVAEAVCASSPPKMAHQRPATTTTTSTGTATHIHLGHRSCVESGDIRKASFRCILSSSVQGIIAAQRTGVNAPAGGRRTGYFQHGSPRSVGRQVPHLESLGRDSQGLQGLRNPGCA